MTKFCFSCVLLVFLTLNALPFVHPDKLATSIIAETLRRSHEYNVVISPYLVIDGLWQLYLGASGKTGSQIAKWINPTKETKMEALENYKKRRNSGIYPGVKFYSASILFIADSLKILPTYMEKSSELFGDPPGVVNFGDSAKTVSTMNEWLAKKEHKKMDYLITQSNDSMYILLVSAIDFTGKWKFEFKKENTVKFPFFTQDLKTGRYNPAAANIMSQKGKFKKDYIEILEADALELPYANSTVSLIILLPRAINGVKTIIENLDKVDINDISPKSKEQTLEIFVPKFKFDYNTDLEEELKALGINKLFDKADLGEMLDWNHNVAVDKVLQKAYIEVAERGTETETGSDGEPFLNGNPFEGVRVDHPFVFMVKDEDTVYLAGLVSRPAI